jgi:hypothetical protein
MTVEEGARRLAKLGIVIPPPPAPSPRHLARMQQLQEEHDAKVREDTERTDASIETDKNHRRELLLESKFHKKLLRAEAIERQRNEDRRELSRRRGHREFLIELGLSLGEKERRELEDELSGAFDDTANPAVRQLAAWLEGLWYAEGIDVRPCDSAIANGSANRRGRWLCTGPLNNLRLCLIAAHETGHIVHPDVADPREVLAEDKFHKISVPRELAAWRWVLDRIPYCIGTRRCAPTWRGSWARTNATRSSRRSRRSISCVHRWNIAEPWFGSGAKEPNDGTTP